jgi:hypothetical protein
VRPVLVLLLCSNINNNNNKSINNNINNNNNNNITTVLIRSTTNCYSYAGNASQQATHEFSSAISLPLPLAPNHPGIRGGVERGGVVRTYRGIFGSIKHCQC